MNPNNKTLNLYTIYPNKASRLIRNYHKKGRELVETTKHKKMGGIFTILTPLFKLGFSVNFSLSHNILTTWNIFFERRALQYLPVSSHHKG